MNGSRFTHLDLRTPVKPARRLESFPEMRMGANWRVDARSGTHLFIWTNAKLLVRACMRHSMTQTFFIPFTNT